MVNKCKPGYRLKKGKCVRVKQDTFFRPDSGIKKGILWTALIAIVLGGILGGAFLLFGTFNDTTVKILLTTLILGLGSFAMLGFSRFGNKIVRTATISTAVIISGLFLLQLWEITDFMWGNVWVTALILVLLNVVGLLSFVNKNAFLRIGGSIASSISAFFWLALVWEWFEYSDNFLKLILALTVVAFTLMHISLLSYSRKAKDTVVKVSFWIVVALITIVTGMLIYLIFNLQNMDFSDMYFRVLGFFAVLDVAGSIALPILKKVRG